MPGPLDSLGSDFRDWVRYVLGDCGAPVTVTRIDPQTGSTTETAEDVTGYPSPYGIRAEPVTGGAVGATARDFWFVASELSFVPQERDQVAEADGTVWDVGAVQVLGFGSAAVYACPCSLNRTDATS